MIILFLFALWLGFSLIGWPFFFLLGGAVILYPFWVAFFETKIKPHIKKDKED